jgi:hypothetical protein
MSAWTCRHTDGKVVQKIVPPRPRIPWWKGPGADSEEKQEPASDIDTALVDSLKVLDPKGPIREADIVADRRHVSKVPNSEVGGFLFDHLVGPGEQCRWHGEAERPSGLEIDYQFELGRLLGRQVRRLRTLENLVNEARGTTI